MLKIGQIHFKNISMLAPQNFHQGMFDQFSTLCLKRLLCYIVLLSYIHLCFSLHANKFMNLCKNKMLCFSLQGMLYLIPFDIILCNNIFPRLIQSEFKRID